jgi:hypothetical protein
LDVSPRLHFSLLADFFAAPGGFLSDSRKSFDIEGSETAGSFAAGNANEVEVAYSNPAKAIETTDTVFFIGNSKIYLSCTLSSENEANFY